MVIFDRERSETTSDCELAPFWLIRLKGKPGLEFWMIADRQMLVMKCEIPDLNGYRGYKDIIT